MNIQSYRDELVYLNEKLRSETDLAVKRRRNKIRAAIDSYDKLTAQFEDKRAKIFKILEGVK
jgi:hypothetical protein